MVGRSPESETKGCLSTCKPASLSGCVPDQKGRTHGGRHTIRIRKQRSKSQDPAVLDEDYCPLLSEQPHITGQHALGQGTIEVHGIHVHAWMVVQLHKRSQGHTSHKHGFYIKNRCHGLSAEY